MAAAAALACLAGASSASPITAADRKKGLAEYFQRLERVAPRVHVLRQPGGFHLNGIGNVLIVEQSDGVVLVDSGASKGVGMRVVEAVKRLTVKPVKAVVITHWHNDHSLGLPAILEAWPRARVIAGRRTVERIKGGAMQAVPFAPSTDYDTKRRAQLQGYIGTLGPNMTDAKLTESERRGWRESLAVMPARMDEAPGTYVVTPTEAVDDRLVIEDPLAPVEVLFLGRANTDGDVEVWLPKQRVVATGDVVTGPAPYEFNVYPSESVAVLRKLKALPFVALVPGHGPVQRDRHGLDLLIGFNEAVIAYVGPRAKTMTLEEASKGLDVEPYRLAIAGKDPWTRSWFDQYALTPLVDSVYREARGEPLGPPGKP